LPLPPRPPLPTTPDHNHNPPQHLWTGDLIYSYTNPGIHTIIPPRNT
jgi:hypothetical protein